MDWLACWWSGSEDPSAAGGFDGAGQDARHSAHQIARRTRRGAQVTGSMAGTRFVQAALNDAKTPGKREGDTLRK